MKRAAIYVRVSTRRQDTRSQEPDLKNWAASHDGEVTWYRDNASGVTMDRPGWKRLEADLRSGKVQTIVVWKLDRLGRTAKGLTALFSELRERKINLVSLKDSLDLSTPPGRLMANVLASVAEYETEVRSERISAGQKAARAAGKTWGESKPGVRKKVNEVQIRMIRRMRSDGETIAAIARSLSLSRPTVYDVLGSTN